MSQAKTIIFTIIDALDDRIHLLPHSVTGSIMVFVTQAEKIL
jgi:hypothetical protein